MEQDFWLQRWQKREIGFHQDAINTYLQHYWPQLQLAKDSQVFVPLCGKSLDMCWLREQGFQVLGVELSEVAIKAFFAENNLQPEVIDEGAFKRWQVDGLTILQGDLFQLTAAHLQSCTAVFDRASLIALPIAMREQYAQQIIKLLPHSQILMITLDYPQHEMSGPPFSVEKEEVKRLYQSHYSVEALLSIDILSESPRFQEKGVTRFMENVYRITPNEA
jgi:thiopurine S-methyltransferase